MDDKSLDLGNLDLGKIGEIISGFDLNDFKLKFLIFDAKMDYIITQNNMILNYEAGNRPETLISDTAELKKLDNQIKQLKKMGE